MPPYGISALCWSFCLVHLPTRRSLRPKPAAKKGRKRARHAPREAAAAEEEEDDDDDDDAEGSGGGDDADSAAAAGADNNGSQDEEDEDEEDMLKRVTDLHAWVADMAVAAEPFDKWTDPVR